VRESTRCILSGNIRRLRREKGWSQEQLAEQCGLHRTYIGAIERSERNIGLDNLERLAKAFDIPVSTLLINSYLPHHEGGVHEPGMRYTGVPSLRKPAFQLH
jgi:transcriptional regulator with XRE-family HTH domain